MADTANFIWQIVEEDTAAGSAVNTRFPPEPNGYLHIGHAKSMYVNFGTAARYGGTCNLFFDDTNPSKEKTEFVDAIRADIAWLGYRWEKEVYASDFFEIIYDYAEQLIAAGKAFVCDYSAEEIKATRGTLTEPGQESPYRSRTPEENLRLFREMKAGKYADGEKCLRAKIDMASPNINLRDPVIYRILRATHHRTGDKWCIYPMYDYAHPICDYLQGVTHSLCTSVIRLGGRDARLFSQTAPDRICAAQSDQPRHEQAVSQKACGGRQRARVGRSAHAHACGAQKPRDSRRGDQRFLRTGGGGESQFRM